MEYLNTSYCKLRIFDTTGCSHNLMTVMMFGIVEDFREKKIIQIIELEQTSHRFKHQCSRSQNKFPKFLEIETNFAWNCKRKFVVAENQIRYRRFIIFLFIGSFHKTVYRFTATHLSV